MHGNHSDNPYFYPAIYYSGYGPVPISHSAQMPIPNSDAADPDAAMVGGGDFSPEERALDPDSDADPDADSDPDDFTEGDSSGLQREGDEEFETDMGAS